MIQLVLDTGGVALAMPESGAYDAHEEANYRDVKMISGRLTREYKGKSWVVSTQTGYFDRDKMLLFLEACKKGQAAPILCSFLVRDSAELVTSQFFVTEWRPPRFMWSKSGEPLWGDYYVSLTEVMPHA